jgi:hypothetical protein
MTVREGEGDGVERGFAILEGSEVEGNIVNV